MYMPRYPPKFNTFTFKFSSRTHLCGKLKSNITATYSLYDFSAT